MGKIITLKKIPRIIYPVGFFLNDNILTIRRMAFAINRHFPNGDISLWCRGSSGAIIASGIATVLYKRAITISYILKLEEKCHGGVRKQMTAKYNIVVDDLIASGRTVDAILSGMTTPWVSVKPDALCIGGDVPKEYRDKFPLIIQILEE